MVVSNLTCLRTKFPDRPLRWSSPPLLLAQSAQKGKVIAPSSRFPRPHILVLPWLLLPFLKPYTKSLSSVYWLILLGFFCSLSHPLLSPGLRPASWPSAWSIAVVSEPPVSVGFSRRKMLRQSWECRTWAAGGCLWRIEGQAASGRESLRLGLQISLQSAYSACLGALYKDCPSEGPQIGQRNLCAQPLARAN